MKINRQIRARRVRVVDHEGQQVGVMTIEEALQLARSADLDLVEVVPTSQPPVCKVIDYGKFRYDQAKKEKESKKSRVVVKVKEIKVKPNIDNHDFETKLRRARRFIEEGNKVKVTCMFRGREMAHTEIGERVVKRMCDETKDIALAEGQPKRMGRFLHVVLAPLGKKRKTENAKDED